MEIDEFDRTMKQADGNQLCFYCNFALQCGQEECIWRENASEQD